MNGNSSDGDADNELEQTYVHTHNKLVLIENTLRLLYGAQERNPSPDERRELDRQILEAEEERNRLNAQLTALLNQGSALEPPSQAEVDETAELTGEVERQTNSAVVARDAIDLCTRVLRASRGQTG